MGLKAMTDELRIALARLREGTEVLRTGGGAHLTAAQCNLLLDHIATVDVLRDWHEARGFECVAHSEGQTCCVDLWLGDVS